MWVSLNPVSGNRKVGPIPVSTTEEASCPKECPLKGTDCYARFGPLGMHWKKVKPNGRGGNWSAFCKRMRRFPSGTLFRHNQAGDLPKNKSINGRADRINKAKLYTLVRAVGHLRGWTYTHFDPTIKHNAEAIKLANDNGFTVNLSADSVSQADEYLKLGIAPVTVTLPSNAPLRGNKTPDGHQIVVCPAQISDEVSCMQCKLCQYRDRKFVIGFLAHGTASKRLTSRLEG